MPDVILICNRGFKEMTKLQAILLIFNDSGKSWDASAGGAWLLNLIQSAAAW